LNSLHDGGLFHSLAVHYCLLGGLCIAGAIFALKFQKLAIILSTSFVGSYMMVVAFDYFTNGEFSLVIYQIIHGNQQSIHVHGIRTYIELGIIVFFFLLGFIIQFRYTGKNFNHKSKQGGYKKLNNDELNPIFSSNPQTISYNTFVYNGTNYSSLSHTEPETSPPPNINFFDQTLHECKPCEAKGITFTNCSTCLGSGFILNNQKCPTCEGKKLLTFRCAYCNGLGRTYQIN